MTRLLIGYDASDSARAAITAAAALFPGAQAIVATVQPPPPTFEAAAMARIALPDSVIREGIERLQAENERQGRETVAEGAAAYADVAGSPATTVLLPELSVWRALRDEAREREADVLVCGTRGQGRLDRFVLGSTASSLVHHLELPLLIVPAGASRLDGPVMAGYDDSDGARGALRFAAAHLPQRRYTVAYAWRSPVRHNTSGQILAHSGFDVFEEYATEADRVWAEVAEETADEGAAYARTLGLEADAIAPESGRGATHALLDGAQAAHAAALLVGSRGRGAVASTVLGSVASGLVHAAAMPVLVIPGASPLQSRNGSK